MIDTCPDFEQLSAYVDGELSTSLSLDMDEHVVHCRACRDTLHRLWVLHGGIGQPAAVAPDLLPAIMQRVECERHAHGAGVMVWRRWRPVPLALAAGVVLWAGVLLGHTLMHQQTRMPDELSERMRLFDVAPPGSVYGASHVEGNVR